MQYNFLKELIKQHLGQHQKCTFTQLCVIKKIHED